MKKRFLFIYIILLSSLIIGYSSFSADLDFRATTSVAKNVENYNVIFSGASLDGVDVFSSVVDAGNTSLEFEMGPYLNEDDSHTLTYRVTNNSTMYDTKINVSCDIVEGISVTMTNSLANTIIPARESMDGEITIKVNQNLGSEQSFSCVATSRAIEKTEISTDSTTLLYSELRTLQGSGEQGLMTMDNASNNDYPILYYSGEAANNVIFSNLCFKIIRTTENGGIKLIYNGVPTDGVCANSNNFSILPSTSKYDEDNLLNVSYIYDDNGINSSTIKNAIDAWYMEKIDLSGATSRMNDTPYCNDITKTGDVFNSYTRLITDGVPTLSCATNNSYTFDDSIGNGLLEHKVGLISADEVMLATDASDKTYLASGASYWTMTPYECDATSCSMFIVTNSGSLDASVVDQNNGIRPVITLKNDTIKLRGNGKENNPFIIK